MKIRFLLIISDYYWPSWHIVQILELPFTALIYEEFLNRIGSLTWAWEDFFNWHCEEMCNKNTIDMGWRSFSLLYTFKVLICWLSLGKFYFFPFLFFVKTNNGIKTLRNNNLLTNSLNTIEQKLIFLDKELHSWFIPQN